MVLPVIVVLMLAVVQVGLVARDYVIVHHAVRESARQAALDPVPATAVAAAAAAAESLDSARLAVALDGGRSTGDLLTVSVEYRSPTAVPLVGAVVGDVTLNASAVVRVE